MKSLWPHIKLHVHLPLFRFPLCPRLIQGLKNIWLFALRFVCVCQIDKPKSSESRIGSQTYYKLSTSLSQLFWFEFKLKLILRRHVQKSVGHAECFSPLIPFPGRSSRLQPGMAHEGPHWTPGCKQAAGEHIVLAWQAQERSNAASPTARLHNSVPPFVDMFCFNHFLICKSGALFHTHTRCFLWSNMILVSRKSSVSSTIIGSPAAWPLSILSNTLLRSS